MKQNFTLVCLLAGTISFSQGGNVGIGTTSPAARLQVAGGDVIFTVNNNFPVNAPLPVTSDSRRMMWLGGKSAFRAGEVFGTQWDSDNVGQYSFAAGSNVLAKGAFSAAFGQDSKAYGGWSFAAGNSSEAGGLNATAIGSFAISNGDGATAIGLDVKATGNFSTALGSFSVASGKNATALGFNNTAASGYETTIGTGATLYTPVSANGFSPADRLFTVGNGDPLGSKSNALTILKNGNTGIGTSTPTEKLEVAGTIKAGKVDAPSVTSPATGGNNMLAVAYGLVYGSGVLQTSSGNCTINQPHVTGIYTISFNSSNLNGINIGNLPVVVGLFGGAASPGFITWQNTGNGAITIYTFNSNGVLADRGFSFAVYKP